MTCFSIPCESVGGGRFWAGGYRRHAGFSLVELMVALTISLMIIGAVIITYLLARNSRLSQGAEAQLQEAGIITLGILTKPIRAISFSEIDPASLSLRDPTANPDLFVAQFGSQVAIPPVVGCANGFVSSSGVTGLANVACANPTGGAPGALSVGYQISPQAGASNSVLNNASSNCVGSNAHLSISDGTTPVSYEICRISLSGAQLQMTANSLAAAPQTVANNVQDLQFRYALTSSGSDAVATQMLSAAQVTAANADLRTAWSGVTGIEVCILISIPDPSAGTTTKTFNDCSIDSNGQVHQRTITDTNLWRAFRTMVALRGRIRSSPANRNS